jgi:hypothetical protein
MLVIGNDGITEKNKAEEKDEACWNWRVTYL